ncbi:MAG: glutamine synthetase [Chloroflexi bacterium]|nr:glutamine synthetase [Chloroflexota bacterium]
METVDRKEAQEFVLHTVKENDVKFIRLWFTDILGNLKGFAITVEELREALERGKPFDGGSIEGFARLDEADMIAMPDPTTFTLLPWRPRQNAVAKMFCDILTPEGEPFEGASRQVLKRSLKRAADLGFTYYAGVEHEFFYFKDSQSTQILDQGGYFDQTSLDWGSDLRRETVLTLEQMGIAVEYSHHEGAPSQHEIDLRYADGLAMADGVATYRVVVKEIANKQGVYASFMPKPINGVNGSGMHVTQSLFQNEGNAFYDRKTPDHLSMAARQFIAGQLRYAPEMSLVTNQWVNSYKRLIPGFEAPIYSSWAHRSRSDLIRIPDYRPGREDSTRIEYRGADSACNPYLALSVLLAAGLEGIERKMKPPEPLEEDAGTLTEAQLAERGVRRMPGSLKEAIQAAEASPFMRKALGEHVYESLVRNKKLEWEDYRSHVHDYELKRYLPIL